MAIQSLATRERVDTQTTGLKSYGSLNKSVASTAHLLHVSCILLISSRYAQYVMGARNAKATLGVHLELQKAW